MSRQAWHHLRAGMSKIVLGDSLSVLLDMPDGCVDLIYITPPVDTLKQQQSEHNEVSRAPDKGGDTGLSGRSGLTIELGGSGYAATLGGYLGFLSPRFVESRRVLKDDGSFFLHIDYSEAHYCKMLLDLVFGRGSFMNEIIWAYGYSEQADNKWPEKHDSILWYAKNPSRYTFVFEEMDRIPYMAPGLVSKEKAARGKTPTDVWWHTIINPNNDHDTAFDARKPAGVLERIIKVHSRPGEMILDFFAGSGSIGEAAHQLGREYILIDDNSESVKLMLERLGGSHPEILGFG